MEWLVPLTVRTVAIPSFNYSPILSFSHSLLKLEAHHHTPTSRRLREAKWVKRRRLPIIEERPKAEQFVDLVFDGRRQGEDPAAFHNLANAWVQAAGVSLAIPEAEVELDVHITDGQPATRLAVAPLPVVAWVSFFFLFLAGRALLFLTL
jgi:hypothetical protein